MQAIEPNQALQGALTRFDALYPLLVKQKVKDSGIVQTSAFMSASNTASRETQRAQLANQLTTQDRLKLVNTLSKSEVIALSSSADTLN